MSAEPVRPESDRKVDSATVRRRLAAIDRIEERHRETLRRRGGMYIEVDDVLDEVRYGDLRDE